MSRRLKRKEDLRRGLQRISEKRLQDMLQLMSQVGLTAERVHDARKVIKSLRAILRLTAGALPIEVRKTRNQALRDLADRLSGPRDAAVTLATFEKTYRESLKKNSHPTVEPRWARATATVPGGAGKCHRTRRKLSGCRRESAPSGRAALTF